MKNTELQNGKSDKTLKAMKRLHKRHFYTYLATKAEMREILSDIKDEMFDGIILNLKENGKKRSHKEKKRIVRRHVEKRAAQAVHRHIGRRDGRFPKYQLEHSVGLILTCLDRHQACC